MNGCQVSPFPRTRLSGWLNRFSSKHVEAVTAMYAGGGVPAPCVSKSVAGHCDGWLWRSIVRQGGIHVIAPPRLSPSFLAVHSRTFGPACSALRPVLRPEQSPIRKLRLQGAQDRALRHLLLLA